VQHQAAIQMFACDWPVKFKASAAAAPRLLFTFTGCIAMEIP